MKLGDIRNALPLGYKLNGEYIIEQILGHGGFGITYLARDIKLGHQLAIKEYLPKQFAIREGQTTLVPLSGKDEERYFWGLDRFKQEGQILAGFDHPNIVQVIRLLKNVNNTAYLVMRYEAGETLARYLGRHGALLNEETILKIFLPTLDGLREVHKHKLLHRDIKPSNIYIRTNCTPMLIDFGSARYALGDHSQTLSIVCSAGYSPPEQLSKLGRQGEWTDIYSVGASIYTCMTGKPPTSAEDRSNAVNQEETDPYVPVRRKVLGRYSEKLLNCVDAALQLKIKDRPQEVREFQKMLTGEGISIHEDIKIKAKEIQVRENEKPNKALLYSICILGLSIATIFFYNTNVPDKSNPDVFFLDVQDRQQRGSELDAQRVEEEIIGQAGKTQDNASIVECDRLAASPYDSRRIGAGIEFDNLNASLAISACEQALKLESRNARLQYQYARSLEKQGNYNDMIRWYKLSAEQGYAIAQNSLGAVYARGRGVFQSDADSLKWYRKAAEQGDAIGQANIGWAYLKGIGVAQSDADAFTWYRKAAEQGNVIAQVNLGWMHQKAIGTERNEIKALEWFRLAAEQGHVIAQVKLGIAYERVPDIVERNYEESRKWYLLAAEQGSAYALRKIGHSYYWARDINNAIKWYRKAAEKDDVEALNNLGVIFGTGKYQDETEAIKWFQKAVDQGSDAAQENLAVISGLESGGLIINGFIAGPPSLFINEYDKNMPLHRVRY